MTGWKDTGLDGRTTRSLGYLTSQKLRKRIGEVFGWAKKIGGLRRTREQGVTRVGLSTRLILCAYYLVRPGKLRRLLKTRLLPGQEPRFKFLTVRNFKSARPTSARLPRGWRKTTIYERHHQRQAP